VAGVFVGDRMSGRPLVSVGMPVLNGAPHLSVALESVLNQDYDNLEIIVSDNVSTDDTANLVQHYASRDHRVRYFRQKCMLTAFANFRFVLDRARGQYFMWTAHDDTRSLDYVSRLLPALESNASVILSFGDLYVTDSLKSEGRRIPYSFDNTDLSRYRRMWKAAHMQCFHIYGLWRTEILRGIRYQPCTWWPDLPIMTTAAYLGKFKYIPGPRFTYLEVPKNYRERAAYQDGRARFNRLNGVLELVGAAYKTSVDVGGMAAGLAAGLFVAEKQFRQLPGFLLRALKRSLISVRPGPA
jgi:glycosyltransferase involved in cell wall biosynthesis